ncbi:MAG: CehA/McbA family metallohydrolase [Anaerolineae bacterium]|nr:CehA/McbA family metallohydrolase [Anaerolineae bacterium]
MKPITDGPKSPRLTPVELAGNISFDDLPDSGISEQMAHAVEHAPRGDCICWGIPFTVGKAVKVADVPVTVAVAPTRARWWVFMHTSDVRLLEKNIDGFIFPMRGAGQLNELAAHYVLIYADGTEARVEIRRRHHVGAFQRGWGENCFQAVAQHKPYPTRAHHEQIQREWGQSQTRAQSADWDLWTNWLWALENPCPDKTVVAVRFEPVSGVLVVSGLAVGDVTEQPLRWRSRRKAILTLPEGVAFEPDLDDDGRLNQLQLDMGQVISTLPRPLYPNTDWAKSYNNQLSAFSEYDLLIEYTSHPDAHFHLANGHIISVRQVEAGSENYELRITHHASRKQSQVAQNSHLPTHNLKPIPPATQRITLKVIDRVSRHPVAVKLHVHGEAGEYLAPVDRHRIINAAWFEDYSADFTHNGQHSCTYIPGETVINLPLGNVYVEISKGFEIRPVRKVIEITADTDTIVIELEKVLPWRERGWVTADTHVHFLSPMTAMLEGAGEGVNVVNLLASQWGELMTNVGDFDGKNTWGAKETGGIGTCESDGEYLVRVGTENRQHILGHISLLGYRGPIIAPMTTGGPDESALGDPIEILLTEWARQCKKQGGLVVLPHFPNPRAEHAASIISGDIDALEMTSWSDLYSGINPYSLSDWYRYLNCGYLVAAVGGTDKMWAGVAVGTVRTYAHIAPETPFTYNAWMDAVRRAETFVTYGPLLEFSVDGQPMGSRIAMTHTGGTVDVVWQAASVTVPMSRVELVVNGEIRESVVVDAAQAGGSWSVKVEKSSWLALLIRGHYEDKTEIIAAHSSPVMVDVEGSQLLAAADAVTILEQIEGALAYLDTVGTRAEDRAYKRMRLVLESAHRSLHNRMHRMGYYHDHTPVEDHPEHH